MRDLRVAEDLTTCKDSMLEIPCVFFLRIQGELDENTFVSTFSLENDRKGLYSSVEKYIGKCIGLNLCVLNLKSVFRSLVLV